MSFFRSFINHNKNKNQDKSFGVQQWLYYRDLVTESSQYPISSLRYSRLQRSLYNLIYTPNDELDYFIDYTESCSLLSSCIQFILDTNIFNRNIRENTNNDDQQTEALVLFHRYLSLDSNFLVPINDEIRRTTLSLICPIDDSTKPDHDCFRMARDHIWQIIEQNIYPEYLQSSYHINYQLKLLTSHQIELHDIFYDSSLLPYLIDFAEKENILDYLQFWIDVERFHQTAITDRNIEKTLLTDNALRIYDRYISLQASVSLGFDDAIRAHIECRICQADMDAGPSIDTFDQAVSIVYRIFEREYFPKFLKSDRFYRCMSHLMLKLRCEQPLVHMIKTLSLKSDELPSTIQIDDETNRKGSLSMGYVDSLGRFVRNSDIDSFCSSTRKTYSNPIEFLSQFVRNDHDELAIEQEAVKFAEAFINEITNRTKTFSHK